MAVSNTLARRQESRPGLAAYLTKDAVKGQIAKIVGGANGTRFISSIISAASANPQIQECDNASIVSAALLGHSLNLSPSPQLGQFYMVPFNDKERGKLAQFILGYKGMIQLALRSGQYRKLNVLAIKEGELIRYDPLEEEIEVRLIEDEQERENARTIGYYAMFEYLNGFRKTMYWSKEKMLSHADRYSAAFSKDGGPFGKGGRYRRVSFADYEAGNFPQGDAWMYSSFWYKDFDGMAYKTMLRQLISKWGIMSIDMEKAIVSDNTVDAPDGESREYVETEEYSMPVQEPAITTAAQPDQSPAPTPAPAPAPSPSPEPAPAAYQQQGLVWG